MLTERIPVKGALDLILYENENQSRIIQKVSQDNLVLTAGKNFFARKIGDDVGTTTAISYIRFGSGDTPPTASDTALEFQLVSTPIQFRSFENNTIFLFSSFGQGEGVGTFREAGLFDNSDPNQMLCRIVMTLPFTKESDQFLSITWRLQIG